MTDDEIQIVTFLRGAPESDFARREIARKAVRRKVFEENPHWVDVPLASLLSKGIVEKQENGLFRISKDKVLAGG